jgi:hypothetical protein
MASFPHTVHKAVQQLGPLPDCFGYHETGDEQCDGAPCSWRLVCMVYQSHLIAKAETLEIEWARLREAEVLHTRRRVLISHALRLYFSLPKGPTPPKDPRHKAGWTAYRTALEESLPIPVRSCMEQADYGELYWKEKYSQILSRKDRPPYAYSLCVRRTKVSNLTLLTYNVGNMHMVRPTIEHRARTWDFLDLFPQIEGAAARWTSRTKKNGARRLGVTAVHVQAHRVPDMGRLAAEALKRGLFPKVEIVGGVVLATKMSHIRYGGWGVRK